MTICGWLRTWVACPTRSPESTPAGPVAPWMGGAPRCSPKPPTRRRTPSTPAWPTRCSAGWLRTVGSPSVHAPGPTSWRGSSDGEQANPARRRRDRGGLARVQGAVPRLGRVRHRCRAGGRDGQHSGRRPAAVALRGVAVLRVRAAPQAPAPRRRPPNPPSADPPRDPQTPPTPETIDDIREQMRDLADAAGVRVLTDAEATRFENLESALARARRSENIRRRQDGYEQPVMGDLPALIGIHTNPRDDTYNAAFTNYLRTGQPNGDLVNAQGVGTDPTGGYLVSPQFRQKLVEVQKAYGGLAAEVDSFDNERGGDVEYPSVDDTANLGAITAEAAAFATGNDLVFGTVTLKAFKYTSSGGDAAAGMRVSWELLQDSEFDIESALDPAYEQNAKWCFSKAAWQKIRAVVDGSGRPLVDPQTAGINGRPARELLGYPVILDQQMGNPATLSQRWGVLGDLREAYTIRRVSEFALVVNPYSRANNGQTEYSAWQRADGNIQNRKAYAIVQNNAA